MHNNGAGGDQHQNKPIRRHSLQPMYSGYPVESVPAATKQTCEGRSNFSCHARMQQHQPNHFHITLGPADHPFITLRQPLHLSQGRRRPVLRCSRGAEKSPAVLPADSSSEVLGLLHKAATGLNIICLVSDRGRPGSCSSSHEGKKGAIRVTSQHHLLHATS
ncbi:MAG: hypothetical protein FRX49_05688 [Trebouxia sp. A1-2]|nr:MAG: hypothetical protein FRX49_05688 [Trebouxia sp. A1-2]